MVEIDGKRYVSPLEDEKRIGKNIAGLQEFELVEEARENRLTGHLPKRFVRLDSNYFLRFIEEIKKNPNSSYETYLDNKDIRKGIIPKNFSVLLKYDTNDLAELNSSNFNEVLSHIASELCAPALMNELGIKTVFNTILVESSGYSQYVLSIDAVKPNEELFCLENFMSNNFGGPIETGLDIVKLYAEFLLERECGLTREEILSDKYQQQIRNLQDEFMVRYLANIIVLGNCDYNARNYAFLINKKTKQIRTFPCFDYEFCFNGFFFKASAKDNMKEIMKRNSKILPDFAKRLKRLTKYQKSGYSRLQEVLSETVGGLSQEHTYLYILNRNIETFFEVYEDVLESQKGNPDQLSIL